PGLAHDVCTDGVALRFGCDPCVDSICASDPFCCAVGWDSFCSAGVWRVCGSLVCPGSAGTCAHTLCTEGEPLVYGCDIEQANCVGRICAAELSCCFTAWDGGCVGAVESICGLSCI
ncbi:MAG: hypothetical protein ACRD1Z_20820, partial [Vicinamibacteria bacterium]